MSSDVVSRKGLVVLMALLCVVLSRHPTSARSEPGPGLVQVAGCGPSMQGVDRLKADLGLDNALANRANTLAAQARQAGQPPPVNQVQSLTEDSLDGLKDASDQLEQAADHVGKQLDSMNLPRQQRAWGKALDDMKKARTKIHYPTRQELTSGSTSAVGIGPKVMYEAANDYQGAVQSLNEIAGQNGFVELGQKNWIAQGQPDTAPPPNPGPDPWQEWLRRMQAQAARIRNNINGLNAARALQAGQFQQALQNASDMRQNVADLQNAANQLSQLATLCNQAAAGQSSSGGGSAPAAAAATGGSGAGGAVLGVLLAGGVAAGAYGYYQKQQECADPGTATADYNSCVIQKNCNACLRWLTTIQPYCDCIEQKHPEQVAGVSQTCKTLVSVVRQVQAERGCLVPLNYTPLPGASISR